MLKFINIIQQKMYFTWYMDIQYIIYLDNARTLL